MSRLETVRTRGRRLREASGPALHTAADGLHTAKGRLVEDVLPRMQETMSHAKAAADPVTHEAMRRSGAAVAALRGEIPVPRPSLRRRMIRPGLFLTGAAGLAGAAWMAWHQWSAKPDRVSGEYGQTEMSPAPDVSLPRQSDGSAVRTASDYVREAP